MQIHFNDKIANKYGLQSAILLENIYYWVKHNQETGNNFKDGKFWTYNSIKQYAEQFPYISEKQIRYALDKLKEDNLIEVGNYNSSCSRTLWYTVTEKAINLLTNQGEEEIQEDFSQPDEENIIIEEEIQEDFSNSDEEYIIIEEENSSESNPEVQNWQNEMSILANSNSPNWQNDLPKMTNHTNKIPQINTTNNIEKEIYKEKESLEREIFNFWNSKQLLKVTEFNNYLQAVISNLLKSFTLENILLSITRYDEVLQSEHYYNHEFTFINFMHSKRIKSFLDEGENWVNYVKWKNTGQVKNHKEGMIRNNYTEEQINSLYNNFDEAIV